MLVCCGVEKAMRQYHYTAWPDHGVPTSAEPIIRMIEMARECQTKADTPVVVHCRCVVGDGGYGEELCGGGGRYGEEVCGV